MRSYPQPRFSRAIRCSPQIFRIAPNQELGALALNMLSKLVTSRNPSLSRLIQNYGDVFSVRLLEPIVCC
jgi:hypothetical protein